MKKFIIFSLLIVVGRSYSEDYDHHSLKKFDHPERSYSVIVTPEGYYPDYLFAFEGEKIRFFVTSTTEESQCLLLKGHELFLSASVGKVTEGEVVFKNPGEFSYYCPGYKGKGKLIVLGKDQGKKENYKTLPVNRGIASENPEQWIPKEY
ncbi:MAG: hypothetical protein H6621_03640 [Halobacteriovoraceae bacterium]|nr:hypothetical protein [Halobacteriovoraceae bacterium]MCB9094141.1 hypothetical protein [Halobacteriovoraceae bacterium]